MYVLLILIIVVGCMGAVAFLNINKEKKRDNENEVDDYEIEEIE